MILIRHYEGNRVVAEIQNVILPLWVRQVGLHAHGNLVSGALS